MSTSSIHLDMWKRGLQDRIYRMLVVTIIHHLVGGPFSLWKLYTIPWSPPFPISSSFTSWLRDSPRRMLYPNESSEHWLPRTMLYSLVFNTWSDHFWGTRTETHGRTHSFGRRLAIFEQSPKLSSNTWKAWPLQPRPTTSSEHAPRFEVPKSAGWSSKHSSIWPLIWGSPSWLWASEGLNLNLLKHTLSCM